ncbi:uncharacterized protein UTRI_10530_B [Ustilago trichophora]|uniref:F-box domain-containing protein n=1 Tax=Ustilago trichophora TaxID=86804 RepID=A0A5C3EBP4_9BASI|nr:uncharacterized protein UTRI_10530_B [Ustilago trichophora]
MVVGFYSEDIASHFRTAVALIEQGQLEQARDCLDYADILATKLNYAVKQQWLDRLKTQRVKLHLLTPCHINRLPNELLVSIARFLDIGDRLVMSQTCNTWRDIILTKHLWTELVINIKQGPNTATSLTPRQAEKWFKHIKICAQKSGHSLETVRIGGPFPQALLVPVLSILRRSAHSLTFIELTALDQERCYSLLYRFCPKLATLNVRCARPMPISGTPSLKVKARLFEDSPENVDVPFLLERFSCDPRIKHPGLAKHMCCLRVLDNYNPYTEGTKRPEPVSGQVLTPIEAQDDEPWSRIADCLEKWCVGPHWPSSEILAAAAERESHLRYYQRKLPVKVTFTKLVKLEGFRLDPNLHFKFPELRELLRLEVGKGHDHGFWSEEFGRILASSPLLKKIDVKLHDRQSVQNDWVMALRGLQNVEELILDISANPSIVLLLLLPRTMEDAMGQLQVDFPLPKLQRLTLTGWLPDAMRLVKILAMRNKLKDGMSLFEAREWTLHRLEPVVHHMRSAAFSHEQKKDIAPAWPPLTTMEEDPVLKVEGPERCRSLEVIELRKLRYFPVQYERTLREIVPKVILDVTYPEPFFP